MACRISRLVHIDDREMTKFYLISKVSGPWADYGAILRHGLVRRDGERVFLQRTGPFVPHVSCPYSEFIVDEIARAAIESGGAVGFDFQPVEIDKVVDIPWENWLGESEPSIYPDSGEPEAYILDASHDTEAAENMPPLFAVNMPRIWDVQGRKPTILIEEKIPEADIFGANAIWVSEKVADAIRPLINDYVQLDPVELVKAQG